MLEEEARFTIVFTDGNASPRLGFRNSGCSDCLDGTYRLPPSHAQVPLPPARLVGRGGGEERWERVHGRQLAACAAGD